MITTKIRAVYSTCLLYTSDAADERSSVDLGGRRIIKKKKKNKQWARQTVQRELKLKCSREVDDRDEETENGL